MSSLSIESTTFLQIFLFVEFVEFFSKIKQSVIIYPVLITESDSMDNGQSRKWQMTFNNPAEHGVSLSSLQSTIGKYKGVKYWCLGHEIGKEETEHYHLFIYFVTPRPFAQLKRMFPESHIEACNGSPFENRCYCLKDGDKYHKLSDGKYQYTDKSGTEHTGVNFSDSFYESGECPIEQRGKNKDTEIILDLLKAGFSNREILNEVPSAMLQFDQIDRARSLLRDKDFASRWRDLTVTYIFGKSGSGKTRSVMDKYGYGNVYRVTDYHHPFDTYDGQDVIVFEEFRGSLKMSDMLNYLDGYPLLLPCRYFNRQACYTKVFIITNVPPDQQYCSLDVESRNAFFRRISQVIEYVADNLPVSYPSVDNWRRGYVQDCLSSLPD